MGMCFQNRKEINRTESTRIRLPAPIVCKLLCKIMLKRCPLPCCTTLSTPFS
uniref:Uncharacterized protein n=1 Tax=Anopheles quadriannulatus TaxID=34691 RepID=A0A182XT57_ANOQN